MAEFETELVLSAFQKFNEASANMETAYHRLAKEFRSLSQELEQTNQRLERTVAEKERIGRHLRAVLESLECGVLVADDSGHITHKNVAASSLLFADEQALDSRATLAEIARSRPELEAPFDDDGPEKFETSISHGEHERCLHVERRELRNAGGASRGAVFVFRDLTELRALEQQAQRMERLAAMGEMALELAHEIRNPLGGVKLHVSLLESDPSLSEAARGWLQQIDVGIRSLNNAVSNMLSFGRPRSPERVRTDLSSLVAEVSGFLEPLTRERGVEVVLHANGEVPPALVDPDQLRQVLLNLWLNALNAMPSGGKLQVEVKASETGVHLVFHDTGPGLPEDVRERIFDPFFTTDRRGTGLGLAVASSIIRQHGGDIVAEGEPGEGASFRITLPVTEEACVVTP